MVAAENLLVALLGVLPGLPVGVIGPSAFLSTYSNYLFRLDLVVNPGPLLLSAAAILALAALSQWPGLRAIRRLKIVTIVRERGG